MKSFVLLILLVSTLLYAIEPIAPIPQSVPHHPEKAALGKQLFFDPILSKDNTVSCISCHDVANGGSDGHKMSIGIFKRRGTMNSPTVLNSTFNFTQFWNGRAKNLREQVLGPLHNPVEMGLSTREIIFRLENNLGYKKAFRQITHRNTITADDITEMIAEYEKTLITPNAKFDLFLKGKISLSPQEKEGYTLFKTLGCITCHNGINIGGNSFQKMGVIIPLKRAENVNDRYVITKREVDKNVFKVPTLRNIALTAPYFHDGSSLTLQDAVKRMSHHNLGLKLSNQEIAYIVAFLKTLTGELPK